MKKHANIPIFIPHLGCPNQCVFCNQRKITGVEEFDPLTVIKTIDSALATIPAGVETEIAFFGGSFTGIDRTLMCELLKIAHSYVLAGKVSSIRCSTRPDYINTDVLDLLEKYGVRVIELGLQSSDEGVLMTSKRGHTFLDEKTACEQIVKRGFSLVGQMMIGLPDSNLETELDTARFIIDSGASAARIYPTVVFRETELSSMAKNGSYQPISLEEAIERSACVLKLFREKNVEVIRIGLCASENLSDENSYYDGPNHPALGELVENEFYYNIIKQNIISSNLESVSSVLVFVSRGALSKAIGQNKKNKLRLIGEFGFERVDFCESDQIQSYSVRVTSGERKN